MKVEHGKAKHYRPGDVIMKKLQQGISLEGAQRRVKRLTVTSLQETQELARRT